ncbi:hypothetical protein COCCADRAFT_87183, partial [Bipolaris zeicola 26-R-13]
TTNLSTQMSVLPHLPPSKPSASVSTTKKRVYRPPVLCKCNTLAQQCRTLRAGRG